MTNFPLSHAHTPARSQTTRTRNETENDFPIGALLRLLILQKLILSPWGLRILAQNLHTRKISTTTGNPTLGNAISALSPTWFPVNRSRADLYHPRFRSFEEHDLARKNVGGSCSFELIKQSNTANIMQRLLLMIPPETNTGLGRTCGFEHHELCRCGWAIKRVRANRSVATLPKIRQPTFHLHVLKNGIWNNRVFHVAA